jgi:hypothetical protein
MVEPTKGPWEIDRHRGEIFSSHPVEYSHNYLIAENIAERNLTLIAAAPDLLDACQKALRMLLCLEDKIQIRTPVTIGLLVDAIAKTEGKLPVPVGAGSENGGEEIDEG